MRKVLFSFGLVLVSAFYIVFSAQNSSPVAVVPPAGIAPVPPTSSAATPAQPVAEGNGTPSPAPAPAAPPPRATTTAPAPAPAPPPAPKGQYVDGNYTGIAANAYYGNVQVEAVILGGKLNDVKVLQYPDTHGTSVYINSQALPYLVQEAIQAQNANVNVVSGATLTSEAFQQSLSSALAKAKA